MKRSILLGLDIGGSKVEARLCETLTDGSGEFQFFDKNKNLKSIKSISSKRIPTERELGYETVILNIINLIKDVCKLADIDLKELSGIGIGLPGSINPNTGLMINGNTKIFIDKDIKKDILNVFSHDIDIEINNDANCFALAESISGAGKRYYEDSKISHHEQIGLGIILGTGTGGGLIYKGDVFSGKDGGALEVGHSLLVSNGSSCYCGAQGCAEEYLSGTAIQAAHPKNSTSAEIFLKAEKANEPELSIINSYKNHLINFLTNLSNLYNPHYIVLGGGVSNQDIIYNGLEESIREKAFLKGNSPKIYKHQISDSAGVIGAIFLLREKLNL